MNKTTSRFASENRWRTRMPALPKTENRELKTDNQIDTFFKENGENR